MHLSNSTDARRTTMPAAEQTNANPAAQAAANRIPLTASQPSGSDSAAGRHRLTAVMDRLHLRSAWQSVLRRWSTSGAPVSFTSLMQIHGGIDARDANGRTLVEVALKSTLSNKAAIVAALKAEGADLALPDDDGNHLLHRTVLARDLAGVVILLSNQVDADATNRRTMPAIARYARQPAQIRAAMQAPNWTWGEDDNATALHLAAAFSNDPAMIDALARYTTNIDAMTLGGDTPLVWGAIFSANPQIIRQLVTRGADVNFLGVMGMRPLHCLAGSSNHPTVMIPELIAQGANLEARDVDGATALHWATCAPNLSACKVLIASGADVNARAADGIAPVELALTRNGAGAAEITAVLKNADADLQLTDINGNTLLHRLVMQRNAEAIDVLLNHDVDVNVRNIAFEPLLRILERPAILRAARGRSDWPRFDTSKATPLHLAAAFSSDLKIIRALINAGARPKERFESQHTPLAWAAFFSDKSAVLEALIKDDAGINDTDQDGRTLLGFVCRNRQRAGLVTALIGHGADVNVGSPGNKPIELLMHRDRLTIDHYLPKLKAAGANLELPDTYGNRLLHRAVMAGQHAGIEALLENGVEVNACNRHTSLAIARYAQQPQAIEALMRRRRFNWGDADNLTPLHLAAAFSNNPDLIRLLLQHRADVSVRSRASESPLDFAIMFASNPAVVDALIAAGADVNTRAARGFLPLHCAAIVNPVPQMIDTLVRHGADVNAIGPMETTALQLAACIPTQALVVRALVRHGAHIEVGATENQSPLDRATEASFGLETSRFMRGLSFDIAQRNDDIIPFNRYLDNGFSHNRDNIIALIECGANPLVQHRCQLRVQAEILNLRDDETHSDNPNWTPTNRQRFRDQFTLDSSTTLAALQHHPEGRSPADFAALVERLHLAENGEASRRAAIAEERAEIRSALRHPLVQQVLRWFEADDRAVDINDESATFDAATAARIRAWHAIKDEPHADEFRAFLGSLIATAEYGNTRLRPDFQQRVAHLLTAIQNDRTLRQHCFLLVEDATISCGDRVGLTLNNLDMARIEHEAEQGVHSAQDLIDIRTSQFRIQILNELAQQKIAQLRPTLGNRIDEIEVVHGAVTLVAEELKLIGVSRTMLYERCAHFSADDKRNALARIAQRESRGEYIKFIAGWQPWQKQLRRLRPADFADLDQRVEHERESLAEQPVYTSDNDYVELCRQMKDMQHVRLAFSLESWTREWLMQHPQTRPGAT